MKRKQHPFGRDGGPGGVENCRYHFAGNLQ